MKVLIVGSGGREHAIAMCVKKSPRVDEIYCAPGNAGIGEVAECVPIGAMEFDKIVSFAKDLYADRTTDLHKCDKVCCGYEGLPPPRGSVRLYGRELRFRCREDACAFEPVICGSPQDRLPRSRCSFARPL